MATQEMVENGDVNFSGFDGVAFQGSEVWVGINVSTIPSTIETPEALVDFLKERIEKTSEGKRDFSTQLKKHVNRVYFHRAHLQDALVQVFELYDKLTAPKTQRSAAWKARVAVLEGMSNKVLKLYATDYLEDEVDNYILTDEADRATLIAKLATILADDEKSEEKETVAV